MMNRRPFQIKATPEDHEQMKLISWARGSARIQTDPLKREALTWLHSIPNGGGRGEPFITKAGVRLPPKEAVLLKATGNKPGVNDLRLDYVKRDSEGRIICPGLIAEMKYGRNTLSSDQRVYQAFMRSQGFAVFTWYFWWVGALDIAEYMELDEFDPVLIEGEKKVRIVNCAEKLAAYRAGMPRAI